MAIEFQGKTIETTAGGYLADQEDWSRELAAHMAAQDQIELTDRHWDLINYLREEFFAVYLNNKLEPVGWVRHGIGTMTAAVFDARIVFGVAVQVACVGVVLAHNHPAQLGPKLRVNLSQMVDRLNVVFIETIMNRLGRRLCHPVAPEIPPPRRISRVSGDRLTSRDAPHLPSSPYRLPAIF